MISSSKRTVGNPELARGVGDDIHGFPPTQSRSLPLMPGKLSWGHPASKANPVSLHVVARKGEARLAAGLLAMHEHLDIPSVPLLKEYMRPRP